MPEFITKDSGERAEFESGMKRDTEAGKPRFDLMFPLDVPYEEQMITRLAALYGRGAVKYEDRNWEKANSPEEMARMKSSAFRHFMQWFCGETDEDHAAGAIFNIIGFETTAYKVAQRAASEEELAELSQVLFGSAGAPVHFAETVEMPLPEPASNVLETHIRHACPREGPCGLCEAEDVCDPDERWIKCMSRTCSLANHKNTQRS